jgi:hypothetical protein
VVYSVNQDDPHEQQTMCLHFLRNLGWLALQITTTDTSHEMFKEDSAYEQYAKHVRTASVTDTIRLMQVILVEAAKLKFRRRPYVIFKKWLEAKGWFPAQGTAPADVRRAPPPLGERRRFIRWNDWVLTPGTPDPRLCLLICNWASDSSWVVALCRGGSQRAL